MKLNESINLILSIGMYIERIFAPRMITLGITPSVTASWSNSGAILPKNWRPGFWVKRKNKMAAHAGVGEKTLEKIDNFDSKVFTT
jgi:hypothetical protein